MLIYSMSVSVDGFVADREGGFGWTAPSEELFRFHLAQVGELGGYLLGRRLYETMLVWETDPSLRSNESGAAFADVWCAIPKVVFSRTLDSVQGNARLAEGSVAEEIAAALGATDTDVSVGGAGLAAQAFELGLVDELRMFRYPVVVGGGTPYLPPVTQHVPFDLVETRTFGSRVIYERYGCGTSEPPGYFAAMGSSLAGTPSGSRFAKRSPLTRAALAFADERHAGQRREADGAPYVAHPLEVASLLDEAGCSDEVVVAGVLHDVLEDSDTKAAELEERFGKPVARLVRSLTEDESIADDADRKAALRRQVAAAGEPAAVIFAADKLSKARELRHLASRGELPSGARLKIEHYAESREMLAAIIPGHPLVEDLRRELEAIAALPANGA